MCGGHTDSVMRGGVCLSTERPLTVAAAGHVCLVDGFTAAATSASAAVVAIDAAVAVAIVSVAQQQQFAVKLCN